MKKFVFIGDSLTFGYGVPKSSSWVSKLKSNCNFEVINKGINGDTTPSMLDRFYDDVISLNPSHIFIMGGTNDLLSHRSISSIIDNIELMIKDALNNNIDVTLGTPPFIIENKANELFMPSPFYHYCASSLPLLREEYLNLGNKYNVRVVDFYEFTSCCNEDIFLDGIHFNLEGQEQLYKFFQNNFKGSIK